MPKVPGSGRKKGGANLKTRAIADKAALEGITPLEVMLEAMRHYYNLRQLNEAAAIAKDAAPYMHPRLATVNVGNKDDQPFRVETGARDLLVGRISSLVAREVETGGAERSNGHAGS